MNDLSSDDVINFDSDLSYNVISAASNINKAPKLIYVFEVIIWHLLSELML